MVTINERDKCEECGSASFETRAEGNVRIRERKCVENCVNDKQEVSRMTKK